MNDQTIQAIDWKELITRVFELVQQIKSGASLSDMLPTIISIIELLIQAEEQSVKIDWGNIDWENLIRIITIIIGLFGEENSFQTDTKAIGVYVESDF